jgi:hypothetical protein
LFGNLSAGHFSESTAARLRQIHSNVYNEHFQKADSIAALLLAEDSTRPLGYLYRAVVIQSEMISRESDAQRDEFFAASDSAQSCAERMLERGDDSAAAYFILGNSHALRALFASRFDGKFKALKEGLAAKSAFSDGYKLDPAFHDLAFGLGSYRYWKSVKTDFINWTPLFKDERADGLRLLRLAADSAEFTAEGAKAALLHVYINEELYGQALQLADDLRRAYPEGITFVWPMAKIFFALHDFAAAARDFEKILDRQRSQPGNYYNYIEAAWHLAVCYKELGQIERLEPLREEITGLTIPEDTVRRQGKKLDDILQK